MAESNQDFSSLIEKFGFLVDGKKSTVEPPPFPKMIVHSSTAEDYPNHTEERIEELKKEYGRKL